ncbi:endonuclease/exonuclease/phosphatase family protein [Halovulum sp. GXIMD14794]
MRIATWNVEWFAELFDDSNKLLADEERSHRYKISRGEQADAIAWVLERIDADLTIIIEAPDTGSTRNTVTALESFSQSYGLRQSKALIGFPNHTMQEIAALYDPAKLSLRHAPLDTPHAPRFDGEFRLDVDVDGQPDMHVFSKPPLELELTSGELDQPFRLIGVHAKSKAPHDATDEAEFLRLSIANRRKQLAQCVWLRRRIDDMLADGLPVMVMGDLNDGPGIDHYEKLFGRSSVEVVLGDPEDPGTLLYDPHAEAWLNPRQGWSLSTARFYYRPMQRYVNALLDYIMVSPDIRRDYKLRWRIWHPFDDPRIYADAPLRDALLSASDHFPVTVDLG